MCWRSAWCGCCSKARRRRRSSASPSPRRRRPTWPSACSTGCPTWTRLADEALAAELRAHPRAADPADLERARKLFARRSRRRAASRSRPSTPSASACCICSRSRPMFPPASVRSTSARRLCCASGRKRGCSPAPRGTRSFPPRSPASRKSPSTQVQGRSGQVRLGSCRPGLHAHRAASPEALQEEE